MGQNSTDEQERQVPHNLEAEQALLGAILLDNSALDAVSDFLQEGHFFDPLHQETFGALVADIGSGLRVSAILLKTAFEGRPLMRPDLTVPQYIGNLVANATTTINAKAYGRTVFDLATRRALIIIGEDTVTGAYDARVPTHDLIRQTTGRLREEATEEGWPEPDPSVCNRVTRAAPEMPLAGFGTELAAYIRAAAAALGAPIDYVGLAIIAGAAGCIGARRYVEIWSGWKEPAIIWVALVGDPSTNKTPATEPVREALTAVEAEKLEKHQPIEEAYEAAATQAKAVKRAWEKAVEVAMKNAHDVPPMPDAAREPKAPVRPRAWIANATIEKLARILAEQPGGLINFCDELAGLIGSFDRYGGEGGDRAFHLELYGGRPYRLDRVKDGSIDIPNMAVSLLGTIQPDRLNRLVLSGDNDGLACRFFYAWPEPRAKQRPATKPDPSTLTDAFRRLGSLVNSAIIPVADNGVAVFEAWWTGPHDAATKATTGMLAEAYGKMNGSVLRLALVFEYLTWGGNADPKALARRTAAGFPHIDPRCD